jgi:hypothetical protein
MPDIRRLCIEAQATGKTLIRIGSVDELDTFMQKLR